MTHHHSPGPPGPPPGSPPTPFPTPLLAQPSGQTTRPGGPPSPFVTAQHPQPPTPPPFGPSPGGPPQSTPPSQPSPRNNTPLILAVLGAVAAVVLIAVLASSGGDDGGGDDGGGGQNAGGNGAPTDLSIPLPGAGTGGTDPGQATDAGSDTTTVEGPTTTNSQGCCDGGVGAQTVAQDLLLAVNDGDEAGAKALLCDPADGDAAEITDAIAGGASLQPDSTTIDTGGGNQYSASLLGLVDGEPITTGYVSAFPQTSGDGWCVDSFFVG